MAIKRFKKIELIGLEKDKVDVLSSLKQLGVLHISNLQIQSSTETEFDSIIDKLKKLYSFLKPFAPKPSFLLGEKVITKELNQDILKIEEINNIYEEITAITNKIKMSDNEINTLSHKIEQLKIVEELDYSLEEIVDSLYTSKKILILSSNEIDEFNKLLSENEKIYVKKIGDHKGKTSFLLINLKEDDLLVEGIISKFESDILDTHNYHGIPRDIIQQYKQEIEKLNGEILENQNKLKKYIQYFDKIKLSLDYYENEKEKLKIAYSLMTTDKTFYIEGFIPYDEVEKVEQFVNKSNKVLYINIKEPSKDDNVPVELHNRGFTNFYEAITDMYGRPNYSEVDPTPVISLFFTFFFGFCLTDAGYGLVIAIVLALVIFNKKVKKILGKGIKLLYVFFFSGIAAMIMGAITGGFFGIKLPEFISRYVPMDLNVNNLNKSAIPFLKFAIYLGAIQVGIGFIMNMIKEIKRKNSFMGIMQNVPNIIIIISGIKLTAALMGTKINTNLWLTLFALSILCNIIFSAPESKGIKRILKGLYNAFFGFTGLMGDILSYMRLFALGLATGILIFVINTVAMVLVKLLGGAGWIFAIILLIVGHIINIMLNSLGAFVHSLRLQFVEFFQKFFEGGGEPYSPLRNKYKYTIFEEEEKK